MAPAHDKCLLTHPAILSMSMLATGKIAFNFASGLIVRPSFSLFFLIYTQMAFVTSVRAKVFAPQMAAIASLSFFGAKMPFMAFLPAAFFSAVRVFKVALVIVVLVVVVATVVF